MHTIQTEARRQGSEPDCWPIAGSLLALVYPNPDPDSVDIWCGRNAWQLGLQYLLLSAQVNNIGFAVGEPKLPVL